MDARTVLVTVGSTVGHQSGGRTGPRRWRGAPTTARRSGDREREPSRCPRRRSAEPRSFTSTVAATTSNMPYELAPEILRQGSARPARLGRRNHRQLGNEAVIVEGHLSIDAAGKGVALQLVLENPCGLLGPAGALGEQVEGKRRHQEPGRLGDDVIVGGRASTAKGRQVVLVPPDLGTRHLVALEEFSGPRPPVEQSPHPDPADQP